MFAEIINTDITTAAWAEIKPAGTFELCDIAVQAVDDATFKLSLTGTDAEPYWIVKADTVLALGPLKLIAGTKIFYTKAISADTTVQTVVRRR